MKDNEKEKEETQEKKPDVLKGIQPEDQKLYECDCGHIVINLEDEERHLKETHDPTWTPKDATDSAKARADAAKEELKAKEKEVKVEAEAKKNLEVQTEQGNLESEKEKELEAKSESENYYESRKKNKK